MLETTNIADPTMRALRAVTFSPFPMHLCGSRFFGDAEPGSDYDFFTLDCDRVKTWLTEIGFKEKAGSPMYFDINTVSVWEQGDVQVILSTNPQSRLFAQEWFIGKEKNDRHKNSEWDQLHRQYEKLAKEGLLEEAGEGVAGE